MMIDHDPCDFGLHDANAEQLFRLLQVARSMSAQMDQTFFDGSPNELVSRLVAVIIAAEAQADALRHKLDSTATVS